MTNIDKLLRDSLNGAGESYEPAHEAEARRTFLRRARRRRVYTAGALAFGGATLVAVAFWLVASDLGTPSDSDNDTASGIPSVRVVARTAVGNAPTGMAVGGESVWVANSGDGTVSLIDLKTNRVTDTFEVGGRPLDIEVAGGRAWVCFENESRLIAVDLDDLSREDIDLAGGGTNLRIAPGVRSLWVVSPDTPLQRIDSATLGITEHGTTVEEPVDLTVGGGKVWVLGASGDIDQIDEVAGLDPESTLSLGEPIAPTAADIAWDGTSLWVSDGDTRSLVRLDPQADAVTAEVPFEGRYANLGTSPQAGLWAVVGDADSDASLLLIDTATGRPGPGSITLAGSPGDVVARGNSVWTAASSGHVFRANLTPTTAPAGDRVSPDEILYISSAGGDLTAVYGDSRVRTLAATPEEETNPSFISANMIVYERRDSAGAVTVVTRDLETSEETTTPIVGDEIAFGPERRVAWVLPKDDPSEQTQIRIGELDGSGEDFFVANPGFRPLEARNLDWDTSGSKLYYEAGRQDAGLYEVEVEDPQPRAIDPPDESATYVGPAASRSNEVVVLKLCCGGPDDYENAELGRLEFGAPEYSKMAGLDDAGFEATSSNVTVEPAGTLDVEEAGAERVWTVTSVRAWIVSDGATAWLVDEEGEIDLLHPTDVTGVAVNPSLFD